MSQERCFSGVNLAERVKLDYDGVIRVYFKGIVFIDLIHLAWVILLHHGHDHAHRGTDLAEEDSWLIAKTLGDRDLTDILLKLVFKPQTEGGNIFFREAIL